MFKEIQQQRIPLDPIEGLEVRPASFGGGYIVNIIVRGKIETAVFSDTAALTNYVTALLNSQALAQMAQKAHEAPEPAPVAAATKAAPRKGRPRLSDEEKAANKARRIESKKLNGKAPDLEVIADPEVAQPAIQA